MAARWKGQYGLATGLLVLLLSADNASAQQQGGGLAEQPKTALQVCVSSWPRTGCPLLSACICLSHPQPQLQPHGAAEFEARRTLKPQRSLTLFQGQQPANRVTVPSAPASFGPPVPDAGVPGLLRVRRLRFPPTWTSSVQRVLHATPASAHCVPASIAWPEQQARAVL